jgi:hypothetical protein
MSKNYSTILKRATWKSVDCMRKAVDCMRKATSLHYFLSDLPFRLQSCCSGYCVVISDGRKLERRYILCRDYAKRENMSEIIHDIRFKDIAFCLATLHLSISCRM